MESRQVIGIGCAASATGGTATMMAGFNPAVSHPALVCVGGAFVIGGVVGWLYLLLTAKKPPAPKTDGDPRVVITDSEDVEVSKNEAQGSRPFLRAVKVKGLKANENKLRDS